MRKNYLFLLILILLSMTLLAGCSEKSSVYSTPGGDYSEITAVDNLFFSIPLSITNKATAVTQITDEVEYDTNNIYSFTNGSDTYILFRMDEVVVLATKGTQFHFSNTEDKASCLNNSSLLNTWFSPLSSKISYTDLTKNGSYKIILDVSAEVVVTTELYGDYIGQLAVIETENEEWSLFAGVIAPSTNTNSLSSQQKEFITNVTQSMYINTNIQEEESTYDIVINQSLKNSDEEMIDLDSPVTDTELNTTDRDSETKDEANPLNSKTEEEKLESDVVMTSDTINFNEIPSEIETNSNNDNKLETENDLSSNSNFESESNSTITINDNISATATGKTGFNVTNQKASKKEIGKAYQSDEYSMLSLGQCGIMSCMDSDGTEQQPIIRINRILTGDEAIQKIKEYVGTQNSYEYYDAPDGYSWHVAEYDVSYENCTNKPYINIKLLGLDGNKLVFRGIPISSRTHDANGLANKDNNNVYGLYCYYAVPNGCKEYALECGDGTIEPENTYLSSYYHIVF